MPEFLYPIGDPEGGTVDNFLARQQADVRRRRGPFEPPEGWRARPDIVPKSLMREAMSSDIKTRGGAVGVHSDALDLGFNFEVQALKERYSGMSREQLQAAEAPKPPTMADIVRINERDAIARTRRLQLSNGTFPTVSVWQPTPGGAPPEQDDEQRGLLDHLGAIAGGVQKAWRASVGMVTGDEPLIAAPEKMDAATTQIALGLADLSLYTADRTAFGLAGAVEEAVEERDPSRLLRVEQGQSIVGLQRAASSVGKAFDGEAFWRSVWVNGGAAIASPFTEETFDELRARAEVNWEESYADLPRPAQILVEETSPGSIALVVAGGPLSRTLLASGTRGSMRLGSLIAPIASNPVLAVPAEIGIGTGLRIGYEETEGAPMPLRLTAAAAVAAVGGLSPFAVNRVAQRLTAGAAADAAPVGLRLTLDELSKIKDIDELTDALDSATPADLQRIIGEFEALRGVAPERPVRPIEEIRRGIVDLDDEMMRDPARFPAPGTIVRPTQAVRGEFMPTDHTYFRVTEEGDFVPFMLTPEPRGTMNIARTDPENIARGRDALLSRLDMEVRRGGLDEEAGAFARAFIDELPEKYLDNLGSSYVKRLGDPNLEGGESLLGTYDYASTVFTIAKKALSNSEDPTRTIVHEISHHLEQFVSGEDARRLVTRFNRELSGRGERLLARYEDTKAALGEIRLRIAAGETGLEAEARALTKRLAADQQAAYRYTGFNEWFAENLTDRFVTDITRPARKGAGDPIIERVAQMVRDFGSAAVSAMRRLTGYDDIADRVYHDLVMGEYNPLARRELDPLLAFMREADPAPMVGLTRSSDPTLPVASAMGDGGLVKMGDNDEILGPIGDSVRNDWRMVDQPDGDVIGGRFVPFTGSPRTRRPPGNKLTPIPDVITLRRDPTNFGVVDQTTLSSGTSRSGQVQTSAERAGDWAAQHRVTVPPGLMQAIRNAQADQQMRQGRLTPAVDFFNHASDIPTVRTAIIAQSQAETEFLARTVPSRRQFIGRVREMFGSTDRLPDKIEYIGPPTRPWGQNRAVDAAEHPLTGTIIDFLENPGYYDQMPTAYMPEFLRFNGRNVLVNNAAEADYGVKIGEFKAPNGVYIPTRDAGLGRIARGDRLAPNAAPGSAMAGERTFPTVTARMADPVEGEGFVPITDLYQLYTRLDMEKAREVGREALRYAMGGSRARKPGWQQVASLGPDQWLPPAEAQDLARYLDSDDVWFFEQLANLKNTTLGADGSPLTIQGSIGWAVAPFAVTRDIVQGLATGARQGRPFRPFQTQALYEDMAAAPQRWVRFFTAMGRAPDGGVPLEWRAQYVERIPGIGGAVAGMNDRITNVLIRGQESTFDSVYTTLLTRGFDESEALAAAADMTKMAWLQSGAENIGETAARQSVERGAFISGTFIRQPVNFIAHAAAGYEEIIRQSLLHPNEIGTQALWQRVGPREQIAAQMMTRLAGTLAGGAAISAAMTAESRGYSPAEAMQNALDPTHPDFLTIWASEDYKLPIGGPFRAMLRAAAPQSLVVAGQTVIDGPVPFGGLPQFLQNRITTSVQTGIDVISNEDFYGNPIRTEEGVMGLLQALAYMGQNTIPISTSSPLEAYQRGESPAQGAARTAFEFMGQQPQPATEFGMLERDRRLSAHAIYNMPPEAKVALGMTPAQVAAARDAQTLTQLREAIGTRAANYLTQQQSQDVRASRDRYVADLRKRAGQGDVEADAILTSIRLQDALSALAVEVDGDRVAYREGRGQLVERNLGESEAFAEVFAGFRQSDNHIDRLTAEKYDLREQAQIRRFAPNGQEVNLGMDWDALEQLELEFDQRVGPELASLVADNMAFASLEANPLEVERRALVNDLTLTGLWAIEEEVFSTHRAGIGQAFTAAVAAGQLPFMDEAALNNAIQSSRTATEFRQSMKPYFARAILAEQPRLTDGEAQRLADDAVGRLLSGIDDEVGGRKRLWVSEHVDDDLARRAYEWGYLSTAQYRDGGGLVRLAEPEPQSANVQPDENQQMQDDFVAGMSYGRLAIKYDLTRDAVIGRLKRRADGAPSALRV